MKLCIDFKLCALKQGKVFSCLKQGPAIGGQTGNALYVTLLRYEWLRGARVKKGWRSGESARLPPIWPGLKSWC